MRSPPDLYPPDRGPPFIAYTMTLLSFTIMIIGLRFLSRAMTPSPNTYTSRFWWDDWLALASVPFILTSLILTITLCRLGLGRHVTDLDFVNIEPLLLAFFSTYYIIGSGILLIKTSAILFLSRIFSGGLPPKWFTIGLYLAHSFNVILFTAFIVTTSCLCQPIEKYWRPLLPGHCMSSQIPLLTISLGGMVLDILILVLPLPMIYRMRLRWRQKLGLFLVFLLAYSTIVVSIGRVISTIEIGEKLELDPTYAVVPSLYWFYADGPITLISTCVPAMISLGRRVLGRCSPPTAADKPSRGGSTGTTSGIDDVPERSRITATVDLDLQERNADFPRD